MTYGINLKVYGPLACFTRPEMKAERVSYDAITPSAARGILEAIYWKPGIRWIIDRITVLQPIQFMNLRRNEVSEKLSERNVKTAMKGGGPLHLIVEDTRTQRAAMLLTNVAYGIEAHFEIVRPGHGEAGKHAEMFRRRAQKGQCFQQPYLGCREFPAYFQWLDEPVAAPPEMAGTRDLGWMLHDIDFNDAMTPHFFRAEMQDGVIQVPPLPFKAVSA